MSNYSNNPDYPTNVGSFGTNIFQQNQSAGYGNQFYYGGAGYGTQMVPDTAARRADGFAVQQPVQQYPGSFSQPQQQVPPQSQIPTGVGQMLSTPEQGVQPYSSYPPNNNTPSFNSFMTDARRADAHMAQAVGNNPWAQNQVPPPPVTQNPGYVPPQQMGYAPMQGDAMTQYGPQFMGNNPFDKSKQTGGWTNQYMAQQPYVQQNPTMWQNPNQVQQPAPVVYSFPNNNPMGMFPQQGPTLGWEAMSNQSWNK